MHFIKSTSLTLPSLTLMTHCTWSRFIWHDSSIWNHVTCRILKQYTVYEIQYTVYSIHDKVHIMSSPNRQIPNIQVLCLTAVLLHHFLGSQCRHLGTDHCKVLKLDSWHTHTHTHRTKRCERYAQSKRSAQKWHKPANAETNTSMLNPQEQNFNIGSPALRLGRCKFLRRLLESLSKVAAVRNGECNSTHGPLRSTQGCYTTQGCLWERKNYHMDSE